MHTQTRVLLGNTAYCNIHLVSIYNKHRRNSLDDRIFGCGAALRPPRIYVLVETAAPLMKAPHLSLGLLRPRCLAHGTTP